MFFTFPEDARWNADRQAVEFRVEIGECCGLTSIRSAGNPARHRFRITTARADPAPGVAPISATERG